MSGCDDRRKTLKKVLIPFSYVSNRSHFSFFCFRGVYQERDELVLAMEIELGEVEKGHGEELEAANREVFFCQCLA